jgi:hypothetical protein
MSKEYTIIVSDEVEAALQKRAVAKETDTQSLVDEQMKYYIGCSLYDFFDPNAPINTPRLSIEERLEVYAVGVNDGEEAARAKVTDILDARSA